MPPPDLPQKVALEQIADEKRGPIPLLLRYAITKDLPEQPKK